MSSTGTMLNVRVLLFAQVRAAAGTQEIDLTLSSQPGTTPTVGDALGALLARHPEVQPHLASCRVAVGLDYASLTQPLQQGDELSLIPPVQGG